MFLISNGQLYCVTGSNLDAKVAAWDKLFTEIVNKNINDYVAAFRTAVGLPVEITTEEETQLLWTIYGETPYKNPDFIARYNTISDNYAPQVPPTLFEFFEVQDDCIVTQITDVIFDYV